MSELPTDAIKDCISYCRCFDDHDKTAPLELQALLDENADLARTVRALKSVVTENKLLHATLTDAKEALVEWGAYIGAYGKKKWGFDKDVATIDKVLDRIKETNNE